MSKATKRKHVTKELLEDWNIPTDSQTIVKLVGSRGNNLHEVIDSTGEKYLVSMPVKFRRIIWVKEGNFVLIEPIPEGDKVKGEIVKILTKDHIKFYRSQNVWPKNFDEQSKSIEREFKSNHVEDTSLGADEEKLFVNRNRNPQCDNFNEESSSAESSESD